MDEQHGKRDLELEAMLQERDRLRAENAKLLAVALEKVKAENAKLKSENAQLEARNAKLSAEIAKFDAHSQIRQLHRNDRREREFELDVTRYYTPKKLDPNGYELATLAHELMGEDDEALIEEGPTVDSDEEYQSPEDDG